MRTTAAVKGSPIPVALSCQTLTAMKPNPAVAASTTPVRRPDRMAVPDAAKTTSTETRPWASVAKMSPAVTSSAGATRRPAKTRCSVLTVSVLLVVTLPMARSALCTESSGMVTLGALHGIPSSLPKLLCQSSPEPCREGRDQAFPQEHPHLALVQRRQGSTPRCLRSDVAGSSVLVQTSTTARNRVNPAAQCVGEGIGRTCLPFVFSGLAQLDAINDPVLAASAIASFDVPTIWTSRKYGSVDVEVVNRTEGCSCTSRPYGRGRPRPVA